jgi:hypothetical protein
MKKLRTYELLINECTDLSCDNTEVNMISLVENPAIEVDFIKFNTDEDIKQFKFKIQNADKRILTGPFMIPDQKIYRAERDNDGNILDEYYVVMSKDTIDKAVKKFFKNQYGTNINAEHSTDVDGAYVIESWFVSGKNDKSKNYGYDLPEGTWFGSIYIENEKYWTEYIKSGKLNLKGFSVEGIFSKSNVPINNSFTKQEDPIMMLTNIIFDFLNK